MVYKKMSDNFYKTVGVQNNIILRGQPLLTNDAKINPVFVEKSSESLEKTTKDIESIKTQLATLSKELAALKSANNKPAPAVPANKPAAKPVVNNK